MTLPTVEESLGSSSPLAAGLRQGERAISQNQELTFKRYARLVLPLDGFVFWVASPLLTPGAIARAAAFNAFAFNSSPFGASGAAGVQDDTLDARGSLHVSADLQQTPDTNYALNRVVFTSEQRIQALETVGPNVIYITEAEGARFAFSSRSSFYRQAGLWHYSGDAVYPAMASQVIDHPEQLGGLGQVVSNSLPAWLAINSYDPPYPVLLPFPAVPLYPSFAVPQNLTPPYGAVHIGEEGTQAVAAAPHLGRRASHGQLSSDRVEVTFYGLNNAAALTFQDALLAYATDTLLFGVTNVPVMRDAKSPQKELLTLAMKKVITFEVSYHQSVVRQVPRQLIESCLVSAADIYTPDP